MPLFDLECLKCGHRGEALVQGEITEEDLACPACPCVMRKLPSAASFKIKGARAANGYGLKFIDTYGKSPLDGQETGCSFTSNRGPTIDHNQGKGE